MKERGKKGNSPVVAELIAAAVCPVHGTAELLVGTNGGTHEERAEAADALSDEIMADTGFERVKESRTNSGKTHFGPPNKYKTDWRPSGSAWGKNKAN